MRTLNLITFCMGILLWGATALGVTVEEIEITDESHRVIIYGEWETWHGSWSSTGGCGVCVWDSGVSNWVFVDYFSEDAMTDDNYAANLILHDNDPIVYPVTVNRVCYDADGLLFRGRLVDPEDSDFTQGIIFDGGEGDDDITGTHLDDTIYGGSGSDTLDLGENENWATFDDLAYGNAGVDYLWTGSVTPGILDGGSGTDYLYGGDADDELAGGTGYDYISGGGGDDYMVGDPLAASTTGDSYTCGYTSPSDVCTIYGDDGVDTVVSTTAQVYAELEGGADIAQLGTRAGTVKGMDGDDVLSCGDSAVTYFCTLYGNGGADTLTGGDYIDILNGGPGDDEIRGGASTDLIYGDSGVDDLYGDGGSDQIHGGSGDDAIKGGNERDYIYGESGSDTIDGEGGPDIIWGGDEDCDNDTYDGADIISGGDSYDVIYGCGGCDEIDGDAGMDILYGNDTDKEFDSCDVVDGGADCDSCPNCNGTYQGNYVISCNESADPGADACPDGGDGIPPCQAP